MIIICVQQETIDLFTNWVQEHWSFGYKYLKIMIDSSTLLLNGKSENVKEDNKKDGLVSKIWNGFMLVMILYFLLSTMEALALSHMKQNGIETDDKEES